MPSIKPPIWSLLILPLFIPFTATAQDCESDRQAISDFFYSLEPTLLETDETPGPYYLKEGETCYYGMAREVYRYVFLTGGDFPERSFYLPEQNGHLDN